MLLKTISHNLFRRIRPNISRVPVRHLDLEGQMPAKSITVNMMSKEDNDMMYIHAYSPSGFRLKTGFKIIGPMVIFPRSILHWNVRGPEDISVDSLSLFTLLEPKIDILVLGIGDSEAEYDKSIIDYLRRCKINVEVLPTDRACSTFNFLNDERRYVAGALIPPSYMHIKYDEDAEFRAALEERQNLFDVTEDYPEEPGEFQDLYENLQGLKKDGSKKITGSSENDDQEKPR